MKILQTRSMILFAVVVIVGISLAIAATQFKNNADAVTSSNSFPTPLYSKSDSMIVAKQISIEKEHSANTDIRLKADVTPGMISFQAVNNGKKSIDLDVSKWILEIKNIDYENEYRFPIEKSLVDKKTNSNVINAGAFSIVKRLDLTQFGDFLETYPGTYSFDLQGMKWSDEMQGNIPAYRLITKITFGYDDAKIIQNPNKLLKADGMRLGFEGDNNSYTFEGESSRRVLFYLYNDQNTRISSVISGFDFLIWNTADRTKADGGTAINETSDVECTYLEPNEQLLVTEHNLSTLEWPFGSKGLSKQYGIDGKLPGLYIADIEVYTRSCTLESGETIPGGERSLTVAFEVKP